MSKRRALLIGVPEYESDAIANLPVVQRDVESLHGSLERSGFNVRSLGTEGTAQTGRSKILQALRRECRDSQGVETLLLYFSGHGMHYRGKDYLIPSDAILDDSDFVEEYLVPTDLGDIIDQSGASTIIFFIDACREGVKLGFKDTYLAGWSRGERRQATRRSFVVVFACGPGQVSQYVGEDEGFSLFSKALAEVLDPQHPAASLEDVLKATQERLSGLVVEHKKQSQQVHRFFESAVGDDTFSRVICEGATTITAAENTNDPWSEAALHSHLWRDKDTDTNPSLAALKQQVAEIVAACWQQWQAAVRAFPEDPWRDEELPIRVLGALELLIFCSDPPIELTDAETALVITVPFVREAVIASGLVHMANANPLSLDGEINATAACRVVLEREHQLQPRFSRKAKRLTEQGRSPDSDSVMAWLLHRCLLKILELWQPESESGYLSDTFYKALTKADYCKSRLASDTLKRERLLELAHCMYTDLERIDRDDRPNALKNRIPVGPYWEEQEVREKMLAYLLQLAGLLAIDIQLLSDVLVDHIGLADPLTPDQILQTVNQTRWNPAGRGRVLRVTCDHPAVDLALSEHVEHGNSLLTHIFRQVAERQQGMEALAGLPTHLLPDGIIAEQQNGVPVYQTPHVNFQLAHDEIRGLLMGEQLYGDPKLAIRELYQNALDACRYRKARMEYLKQTGQYEGTDEEWEGRIIFRQMTDENGRVYIECEDNGIGMGMLHLSQCFARAGRRFAALPEFIEEQAEWLKCDPPVRLYPNSQFGIGVFSYFMLADEIEVDTCRLDRKGKPERRLRVWIPGSSGLFRVQIVGPGRTVGTRVRLYLSQTSHNSKPISCIKSLKELLWVAEFPTECQQESQREIWQPGKLKHPALEDERCLNAGEDLWWVAEAESASYLLYTDTGRILVDGISTEEEQKGVVVNLCHVHYPKLTIDRKKIIDVDKLKQAISNRMAQYSDCLINWEYLSFKWLWDLGSESEYFAVVEHTMALLMREDISLKLGRWDGDNVKVPIRQIGCLQADRYLFEQTHMSSFFDQITHYIPWWLIPCRAAVWIKYGSMPQSLNSSLEDLRYLPKSELCPLPEPGDAIIFDKIGATGYLSSPTKDCTSLVSIIKSSVSIPEPLSKTFNRLKKFVPLGLKIPSVNLEILESFSLDKEEVEILFGDVKGDRISSIQIIFTASKLNESVASMLQRYQKFSALGLEVPQIDPQILNSLEVVQEDLRILSSDFNGEYPLTSNEISIAQIVLAAVKLNEPIAKAFRRFQKFSHLGIKIPQIDLQILDSLELTQEDSIILSGNFDGEYALASNEVSVAQIVLAAVKLNESITGIFQRLSKFKSLGLQIPEANDSKFLEVLNVTQEDAIILSSGLDGKYALSNQVTVSHLVRAAVKLNKPVISILQSLQRFISLGLKTPVVQNLAVLEDILITQEDENILSDLEGNHSFLGGYHSLEDDQITLAHILQSAAKFNEPITSILKRFQKFIHLGLALPDIDLEVWGELIPNQKDLNLFSRHFYAGHYYYRGFDLIEGAIHPSQIFVAAYILDEPVATTLERMRRLAPLLGITLPDGEPDSWQFFVSED